MSAEEPLEVSPDDGTISGKSVVISMFVLAVVLIGALYTYWNLHLMPFMPLQEALAAEFGSYQGTERIAPSLDKVLQLLP